jgi:hypothetical protein
MRRNTLHRLGTSCVALLAWSGVATAQEWVNLPARPAQLSGRLGPAQLLTDGTIIVQENKTPNWWILTPDNMAHYNTGTWSTTPKVMPAGYAPKFFASGVLQDGRFIVEGGEYDYGTSPIPAKKGTDGSARLSLLERRITS